MFSVRLPSCISKQLVYIISFSLIALVLFPIQRAEAQDIQALIEMDVQAGYDSYFREGYWVPLRIFVRNNGDDITGKLTVRPETSGRVVSNTYSTPIDLPNGSQKAAFLYVQVSGFPPRILVELLDDDDERVTDVSVTLLPISSKDQLHVVVAGATSSTIPLNDLHVGGYLSQQATWRIENIPENSAALQAVNTLVFINADTEQLSSGQRAAIADWVAGGGHLIFTGGPGWQATASGLTNLLPFAPDGSATINSIEPLQTYVTDSGDIIEESLVIATGIANDDARIIAALDDDTPLLVRHPYGSGTVDYLVADPTLEPLVSWDGLPDLWLNLASSAYVRPAWTQHALDRREAINGVSILPGVDLLPSALALCGFLAFYVGLIGPLNYLVLARFNRREWAWVTIPLFIIIFSVLAWTVGFNLRGNEITLSRLTLVQSWSDHERAQVQQVIGLLSPRRDTYSLDMPQNSTLSLLPTLTQTGLLTGNITQANTEILQTSTFNARNLAVDGGIFANFYAQSSIERPEFGGSLLLRYGSNGFQTLEGTLRNDSDITLKDPLLLVRGSVFELDADLSPGDFITLNDGTLSINGEPVPAPSPLEYRYGSLLQSTTLGGGFYGSASDFRTIDHILNTSIQIPNNTGNAALDEADWEQQQRKRAFLTAFLRDQYTATSRGDNAYLVGWADEWADDITIEDVPWVSLDTTLYITELNVLMEPPPQNQMVRIMPDQFTWTALERVNLLDGGGANLSLPPDGSITLELRPIDSAILREVEQMQLYIDRSGGAGSLLDVEAWHAARGEWVMLDDVIQEGYNFNNPSAFLGAENQLRLRLSLGESYSAAFINAVRLEQWGRF